MYEKRKKRKSKKLDAKARELASAWEKLKASHTVPLVKGAKANGLKAKKIEKAKFVIIEPITHVPHETKRLPVPVNSGCKPGTKPMQEDVGVVQAKAKLRGRVGQVFPKGGNQYLTDSDLADSKQGLLRRRS